MIYINSDADSRILNKRTYDCLIYTDKVEPSSVQNGGIQGEHRATGVIFRFDYDAALWLNEVIENGRTFCRVDACDSAGVIYRSRSVELTESPEEFGGIYYDIEKCVTNNGGIAKITLVISQMSDEYMTECVIKSDTVFFRFTDSPIETHEEIGEMNTICESAKKAAAESKASALDSEAWATGKREGDDVGIDDPAYQNNAKYYANRADDSATCAESSSQDAAGYKNDAEAARDTAEGYKNTAVAAATSATNAKTAAESAAASASASKVSAETAATNAAASKTAAENAATNAASAQTAAENAQTAAENAQTAAESAQSAAESARDLAEDYKDDAYDYKEAAEQAVASIPVEVYELSKNTHPPVAPNIPVPQLSEAEREEIAAKLQLGKVIIIKWTDTDEYGQDTIDEFTTISYDLDEVTGGIEGFRVTNGDAIADYRLYDGDLLVRYYRYESQSNKVTVISSSSTNTQYPSAKAVWDIVSLCELAANKTLDISSGATDTKYPSAKAVKTYVDNNDLWKNTATDGKYGLVSKGSSATTKATNQSSLGRGNNVDVSARYGTGVGQDIVVSGQDGFAHGYDLQVTQPHASVLGIGLRNNVYAGIRLGKWNSDNANALMQVGNGTADDNRSNAFEVLTDGTIKFGSGSLKGEDGVALSTVETKRMLYRGKNLGTSLTAAQKTAISSGTFTDLYIGDYWMINGVNWRIADIDYFYGRNFNTHHLVIVPDTALDTMAMYDTDITSGAYVGSNVYTALNDPDSTVMQAITGAFGNNVLERTEVLQNSADANGCYNGMIIGASIKAALMNQVMLYGSYVQPLKPTRYDHASLEAWARTSGVMQLALFRLSPNRIPALQTYWLRDVVSAKEFAVSNSDGIVTYSSSTQLGVRPYFCIGV